MMTIHLSEDKERKIRSLMQDGAFATESDVIDEALRLLERHQQEQASQQAEIDRHVQQRENLKRLIQNLDALPSASPNNRDHDLILYGQRA